MANYGVSTLYLNALHDFEEKGYCVVRGLLDPADLAPVVSVVEKYVDAVGHARKLPYPGYWHSRNRYASQDELLEVARGFHNRSIPVDVIVIDWYHWKVVCPPRARKSVLEN